MQNTKFNKSLNILVTGGAGFIGSKLCTKLVNLGAKVTCIDIMKYSEDSLNHLMINKNFIFLKKDVKDLILLLNLVFCIILLFYFYLVSDNYLCNIQKNEPVQHF